MLFALYLAEVVTVFSIFPDVDVQIPRRCRNRKWSANLGAPDNFIDGSWGRSDEPGARRFYDVGGWLSSHPDQGLSGGGTPPCCAFRSGQRKFVTAMAEVNTYRARLKSINRGPTRGFLSAPRPRTAKQSFFFFCGRKSDRRRPNYLNQAADRVEKISPATFADGLAWQCRHPDGTGFDFEFSVPLGIVCGSGFMTKM